MLKSWYELLSLFYSCQFVSSLPCIHVSWTQNNVWLNHKSCQLYLALYCRKSAIHCSNSLTKHIVWLPRYGLSNEQPENLIFLLSGGPINLNWATRQKKHQLIMSFLRELVLVRRRSDLKIKFAWNKHRTLIIIIMNFPATNWNTTLFYGQTESTVTCSHRHQYTCNCCVSLSLVYSWSPSFIGLLAFLVNDDRTNIDDYSVAYRREVIKKCPLFCRFLS